MSSAPHHGQVYTWQGLPALYVRTEKRPGSGEVRHLFVVTKDRTVFEVWRPADEPLTEEFVVTHDPTAQERLAGAVAAFRDLAQERDALVVVMKRAVALMPGRADDLRNAYREARA